MNETWKILVLHQILFQGMFLLKNMMLKRKIGVQIRGKNREATIATFSFALFIIVSLLFSFFENPVGEIELPQSLYLSIPGMALLMASLIVAGTSLVDLKDSWRVGVVEGQQTKLITSGIYRFTRNPYFISYIFLFFGYTIILQNIFLLLFTVLNLVFVHKMILKEEHYLKSIHGEHYLQYLKSVRRYF